MPQELLVSSVGLARFIICPRMADGAPHREK